jgi:hypothetical protein
MLPFSRQIQIATGGAKGSVGRLAGIEVPSFPDTEATFPELKERIAKTVAFLKTIQSEQIDGSEGKTITIKLGGNDKSLDGQAYLLHFVLPNFFFHATTTYVILRHLGVEIGKIDFLGRI